MIYYCYSSYCNAIRYHSLLLCIFSLFFIVIFVCLLHIWSLIKPNFPHFSPYRFRMSFKFFFMFLIICYQQSIRHLYKFGLPCFCALSVICTNSNSNTITRFFATIRQYISLDKDKWDITWYMNSKPLWCLTCTTFKISNSLVLISEKDHLFEIENN